MYLIENRNTKPQYNLALEEHLCLRAMRDGPRSAGSCFFMLWQNEPSIIVGRFQNTLEEINAAYVEEHNIHVVRRNSGGGAVYHDLGNINYSFVMPDTAGDFDFALFTGPIIRALAALGVKAQLSGRNDLAIDGKKISGGAQFRRGGVILHHGTLLYDTNLDILSQALKVSPDKFQSKAVKSVRGRVDNIVAHMPEPLPVAEFMARLQSGIEDLTPLTLDQNARDEIDKLMREKYAARDWNYGTSPQFTERKKLRFPWGGIEAYLTVEAGTIKNCAFYGDYFGSGYDQSLIERLVGCAYTKDDVTKALAGFDPHFLFAGSKTDDLIALLSPEI